MCQTDNALGSEGGAFSAVRYAPLHDAGRQSSTGLSQKASFRHARGSFESVPPSSFATASSDSDSLSSSLGRDSFRASPVALSIPSRPRKSVLVERVKEAEAPQAVSPRPQPAMVARGVFQNVLDFLYEYLIPLIIALVLGVKALQKAGYDIEEMLDDVGLEEVGDLFD